MVEPGDVAGPLHRLGEDAPPLDELRRLARRRRRRRLTGTAVVVATLGATAALVAARPRPDPVRLTSGTCAPAPEPAAVAATPEALPQLAPDIPPGVTFTVQASDVDPLAPGAHLQTFRCGDSLRRISIQTTPAGVAESLGVGTTIERGAHRYTVVLGSRSRATTLTWATPDGRTVLLRSVGVAGDDVLRVAERLAPRPGKPGWDVGYLPSGLGTSVEGDPHSDPVLPTRTISYEAGTDGWVSFEVLAAPPVVFDDLVLDRLGRQAALVRQVRVGRRAGLLFTEDGISRLLWAPQRGVAAELVGRVGGPVLEREAATVTDLPTSAWDRFARRYRPTATSGPSG